MIDKKGFLFVSIIAMMAVCSAHANIASTAYVDDEIQSVEALIPTDTGDLSNTVGQYIKEGDVSGMRDSVTAVWDLTDPNSLASRVGTLENEKQDALIGTAPVEDADSVDAGKVVIVADDGTMDVGPSTDGSIASGDNGLVTGGVVYTALQDYATTSSLGTAAAAATTDFASSAQGAKADSAIQTVKVNGSALTPDGNKAVDITVPAAQVQSDWNASSGMGEILNKPTLGTAAAAATTDFVASTQATTGGILTTNSTTGAVEVSSAIAESQVTNLTTDLGNKINTTVAGDANGVMVRNSSGVAMKATGSDISVANDGALTVNHATKANQIPSGSQNSSTFASIWVE